MSVTARLFSVVLFVVALLPRLYVAIAWTREPVWDGHYYDIGARSIAAGLGYVGTSGGAWCHYPVGYSALLGGAYRLLGTGQLVGPVLNAVLGALMAVLTHSLARRATSERRARLAGVFMALYPGMIVYTPLLMTEPLAALLLVAAAVAATVGRAPLRGGLVAGLLLGLATLVRPQSILCAPAVALLSLRGDHRRAGSRRRALLVGALSSLVAVLTVLPWTARNCVVMDGCAFVSTNAGWNLAIGSFPRATGRFAVLRGSDGCRIVTGQVQQDRCWLGAGGRWIAEDPLRWIALMPGKLGFTFDHESFPVGYLGEADPKAWPEPRKELGRGLLSWSYRALLLLGALAMLERPSRKRPRTLLAPFGVGLLAFYAAATPSHPFWLLAMVIPLAALWRFKALLARPPVLFAAFAVASVALTHVVFFGEDRYHMVLAPFLCLLAALAGADEQQEVAAPAGGLPD